MLHMPARGFGKEDSRNSPQTLSMPTVFGHASTFKSVACMQGNSLLLGLGLLPTCHHNCEA
jgi:hypothetical protein